MDNRGLGLAGACSGVTGVGLRCKDFGVVEKNDGTFGKDIASLSGTVCSFGMTGSNAVGLTTAGAGAIAIDAIFSLGKSSVFIVLLCIC